MGNMILNFQARINYRLLPRTAVLRNPWWMFWRPQAVVTRYHDVELV